MPKSSILFIFSLLASLGSYAQLTKDIFPLNREFKNGGFYISPLLTYSYGPETKNELNINDTLYQYRLNELGQLKYGIEIGWYQSFENPLLVHYMEGGLSYRRFDGNVEHEGDLILPDLTEINFSSTNNFRIQTITASFRAVHAKQLGQLSFLNLAFGTNVNYLISSKYKRTGNYPLDKSTEEFPSELQVQLHFQAGIGLRLTEQILFVPHVEIPFANAYPIDVVFPPFRFFDGDTFPVLMGFKLMFLRKDPFNCNAPIYNGPATQ